MRSLIARGESLGFERVTVKMASIRDLRPEIRDNDRAVLDDPNLAKLIWNRCRGSLPPGPAGEPAVGLDAGFRFYRCDPEQRFKDTDGYVERPPDLRTRLTCLLYLNAEFTGGETAFYSATKVEGQRALVASVAPQPGSALFFRHEWWHEGRPVLSGRKYVLRKDVFYRRPAVTMSAPSL